MKQLLESKIRNSSLQTRALITTVLLLMIIPSCSTKTELSIGQNVDDAIELIEAKGGKVQIVEVAIFKADRAIMHFEFPNGEWLEVVHLKSRPNQIVQLGIIDLENVLKLENKKAYRSTYFQTIDLANASKGSIRGTERVAPEVPSQSSPAEDN